MAIPIELTMGSNAVTVHSIKQCCWVKCKTLQGSKGFYMISGTVFNKRISYLKIKSNAKYVLSLQ